MIRQVDAILKRLALWFLSALMRGGRNVATALVQLWAHKGRSMLTTLGIIIAVTSIITVVSFVEGFGTYVKNMMQGYGTQYIVVMPERQRGFSFARSRRIKLGIDDVEAVRAACPKVSRISPFVYIEVEVAFAGEQAGGIPMRGVNEHYQTIRNFSTDVGRFFGPVDIENEARVCVLGRTLLKHLECDEAIVGEYIHINDRRFRVIGLLESKGSFSGDDQDETVMIPYTTALNMLPEQRESLMFLAMAPSEDEIDQAEGQMRSVLRRRHGLQPGQPDDFIIRRQDQMLKQFNKIRMIATSVLAGIVSISLVVGGIGIMNVMLVSVTERTREIGLRKSVGGRRRDIMLQFLTEAVMLSTLGGAIGVALGYALTSVAALHPSMIEIQVPLWSVALAIGFSAGAGILFGVIPAFKAAIIHPIDALRHE